MQINVKILSVSKPEFKTKGKNKWQEVTVEFEGEKGKQARKILSFNKDVFEQAKQMEVGKNYDVEITKEGDFWNWTNINLDSASNSGGKASAPSGGSGNNWVDRTALDREKFEFEKGDKQRLIIRQSCLANAIAYLGNNQDVDELLSVAEHFVDFVINNKDLPPEQTGDVDID